MNIIVYQGRPQKWLYRLAGILSRNFRVKYYYKSGTPIEFHFMGLKTDVQIAEITFSYAKGIVALCSKEYMQRPEIKRKWKKKWQLKQDYIQGYLIGLEQALDQQVLTNGYELALQLPIIVSEESKKLNLVKGKDTSHKIEDYGAYLSGYNEGLKYKNRDLIS